MSLYGEHVMDHFKAPRGRGTLANATVKLDDTNPLCGDKITVHLRIDEDGIILGALHEASGCAISQAGSSILFEELAGKNIREVLTMPNDAILREFGTTLSVSRVKCALLGLAAVKKAIILNAEPRPKDASVNK